MSTWFHPLLIQILTTCIYPVARVTTVTDNGENTATEMNIVTVQCDDILEGDVAIMKAPITCVLLSIAKVVDDNCQ